MRPNSAMLFGRISVSMGQPRANLARSPAPVPFPAASVSAAHSPNTETEVNMAIINLRDFHGLWSFRLLRPAICRVLLSRFFMGRRSDTHPQPVQVLGSDTYKIPVVAILNPGWLPLAPHEYVKALSTMQPAIVAV